MHKGHRRGRAYGWRNRRFNRESGWVVHARIERFAEAALLLALGDGPSHGYELADRLTSLIGRDVDYGNLYRLLRALEAEGIVTSVWDENAPGRSKRVYELTDHGAALLDAWVDALRRTNERIGEFVGAYERNQA